MRTVARTVLLTIAGLSAACGFEYPTEWKAPERGTFGEEVFKLIRKELSLSSERSEDKVAAFDARRETFVNALDTMVPGDLLRPLHEYFVAQLPLYDDDTLPAFTRKAGAVLGELAEDPPVLEVLAREDARRGYDPDEAGLLARVAQFPELRKMTMRLADILLARYGRDEAGAQNGEPGAFGNLLAALARHLESVAPDRSEERTPAIIADFLLREDDRLAQAKPLWAVRRDVRSVAKVATDPATGRLYAPFVDENPRDGLADVGPAGLAIDRQGRPIALEPFGQDGARDRDGRLLVAQGATRTVFQYLDLRRTLLSSLLPDLRTMAAKDVPLKSLRAARALLGPRSARVRDGETYEGHSGAPVLDLAHGLFAAMASADLPDVLLGLKAALDTGADQMAGALREIDRIDEVRDRHPGGGLVQGHSLEDDLLPVLKEIAEAPGLLQAVLESVAHPDSAGMRAVLGKLLKYKNPRVTLQAVEQGQVFTTLVDRSQPDRGTNKSLFQRMLQLMWETSGVSYEPRALGIIPLGFIFKIDDLAVFYIDVVAGNAEVPDAVTWVTPLSKRPTPREVNRFINTEQSLMSEPVDRDGYLVREHNGDALYALEAAGGIESLRPLAKAFSDRGKSALLVKLFVTLHLHYASPQSDYQNASPAQRSYSRKSGIVTMEAFLQELLGETPFLDRQRDLVTVLSRVQLGGRRLGDVLAGLLRKLVTPDAALRTRAGENRVTRSSGAVVSPVTPWDLVRLGLKGIDAVLDRDAGAKTAWEEARKALVDTLLGTVESQGRVTFQNRRAVVLTSHLLDFLAGRIRKHLDAGTWTQKLKTEYPRDLEDLLTGPAVAAAVEIFDAIDADDELRGLFRSFATHMLPEDGLDGDRLLRLGAKLVHKLMDGADWSPLCKFLARAIRPESGLAAAALRYFRASMGFDIDDLMRGILMRGSDAPFGEKAPLALFGDVLGAVLRTEPGAEGPWAAHDFGRFFRELSRFLLDREKGLEKLITIVKGRR
jgi:hypothetical protein